MVRVNPNAANQTIYLSLRESDKEFATAADYFLMVMTCLDTRNEYALILPANVDNERYVSSRIGTDTDDAINGSILITETGEFTYKVYGQSSATNLDPTDVSVIGVYEDGVMWVTTQESYFEGTMTTPTDINYYE